MRLIYIAGPYRSETIAGVVANIASARAEAFKVLAGGDYPVVPHLNTGLMDGIVPDEHFLAGARLLMLQCAEVRALPGWERSIGTCAEIKEALERGMPVHDTEGMAIDTVRLYANARFDAASLADHYDRATGSKGENMNQSIGHALVAMYGQLTTSFRADHIGGERRGTFTPNANFDPLEPILGVWSKAFTARYGVDRGANVGEQLNGKNFYPDVIEYLLYHPDNPLDMTPESIRLLTTPPINGTREWMIARQDCCCVMVGGIVAMEALENLAKALGYGAAPQPAKPPAVSASTLPELAPVEQRAKEIAEEVEDTWGYHSPAWLDKLCPPVFIRQLAEEVALLAIPIWRRSQERIAQRAAEIVLAKLE